MDAITDEEDDLAIARARATDVASSDGRRDAPYRQWVRLAVVGDVVAAGIGATLAREIRFGGESAALVASSGGIKISYAFLALSSFIVWPVITALCGGYDLRAQLVGVEELRRILKAGVSLAAFIGFVVFALNALLSRGFMLALVPITITLSGAWRILLRGHTERRRATGTDHHNVVAVGPMHELERLFVQLMSRPNSAIDIVAFVADDATERPTTGPLALVHQLPDRDAINELPAMGIEVDLLVRVGRPLPDEMWRMARRAHEIGAVLAVAPHREDASSHVAVSYVPLGHTPLLIVETPTLRPSSRWIKALFDRVVGLLLTVAVFPVLVGITLVLLVKQGRPILFRQTRIGQHGEPFECLKFRTMDQDAEGRLAELLDRNEADGPLFKIRDDPRVTPVGRWLRAHSLDELPQFFNVLGGSMSIVGPRPPLPAEVAKYNEREARRLLVKPGVTGLWQVEGRSDLPWDDGVYLDLVYIDHWSPLLDIVIVARTARAVFRPSGAY